jgi:hypothetical protein
VTARGAISELILEWQQWRIFTLIVAFAGVVAIYVFADGPGLTPFILMFFLGIGIAFGTRGGWLLGMLGLLAATVLVGVVKYSTGGDVGDNATRYVGPALNIAFMFFTPGYLVGALAPWRRDRRAVRLAAADSWPAAGINASELVLSQRKTALLALAILFVITLVLQFITANLFGLGR